MGDLLARTLNNGVTLNADFPAGEILSPAFFIRFPKIGESDSPKLGNRSLDFSGGIDWGQARVRWSLILSAKLPGPVRRGGAKRLDLR